MDNSLQAALKNLVENNATSEEIELLRNAFISGQIFIGGSVQNSVIIVGSGNTVQLNPEAIERLAAVNYLSALHELPQPPADFIGRKQELQKILNHIEKKGGAAISGLIGMAGIGKTVLGLVVAQSLANKYPDAQLFVDLRGTSDVPLDPYSVMKNVVQSFHPTADLHNVTEEELSGMYQSDLSNKRAILFLDNARDASQVMPLRPPKNSLLLVTSRFRFVIPGLHLVELGVLEQNESIELLREICPRITENDAERIAELCENLPIALRLAGSYLQIHIDWSVDEYIANLGDKAKKLESFNLEGAGINITASFEQSYQQLSDNEKTYWSMLSIFPASFKRDALTSIWQLDDRKTRILAGKLHQYSLLEYDIATNRYRVHDLLSQFANSKLSENKRERAFVNYLCHYQKIWNRAEEIYRKGGNDEARGLHLFDTEYEHIKNAFEWVINNKNQEHLPIILKEVPEFFYVSRMRLHSQVLISWLNIALDVANQLGNRSNQANLLGFIGNAYYSISESLKAIEYYKKALEISREIDDQLGELSWLSNIGTAYNNLGEVEKGIKYCEEALTFSRKAGEKRFEGLTLGNIGVAFRNLGKHAEAVTYFEQALEVARDVGDLQNQGIWLGNLGYLYFNMGELQKGIEQTEMALAIARKIGDRQKEGVWLNVLGELYIKLNNPEKAEEYLECALTISKETNFQELEGTILFKFAKLFQLYGNKQSSKQYALEAHSIMVSVHAIELEEVNQFISKLDN